MEGTLWVSWLEYRRRACCDATTEMTFAQIRANSSCVKELGRNRSSRAIWSGVWRCLQRSELYPTAADARPGARNARDCGGCEGNCLELLQRLGNAADTGLIARSCWRRGRLRLEPDWRSKQRQLLDAKPSGGNDQFFLGSGEIAAWTYCLAMGGQGSRSCSLR